MDQQTLWSVESILQTLVLGGIVLAPVLALSIRFALKPLLETYLKARSVPDAQALERRMRLLEAELQGMQQRAASASEIEEFARRLAAPPSSLPETIRIGTETRRSAGPGSLD